MSHSMLLLLLLSLVLSATSTFFLTKSVIEMGGASSVLTPERTSNLPSQIVLELYKYETEMRDQNLPEMEIIDKLTIKYNELLAAPKDSGATNMAFVFIKPHANNAKTQEKVASTFAAQGIKIVQEGEFTGEQIDRDMLIDQHYYAIASKATLLKPEEIPVPAEKFEEFFGTSWADVLASGSAFNALDASKHLEVDIPTLNKVWLDCKKIKFGGGFYCGVIEMEGKKPIYTFNAFFMTMRSKFVNPQASIHYYVVEFSPSQLSWSDFRGKVLGPTDPHQAPPGSLRGDIAKNYEAYGLAFEPTVGDNCVHASASPFEGLAERMNWLKVQPENDPFGARVLAAGISADTIKEWSVDPQVKGRSIFDQLEDKDADDCIATMKELNTA